MKTWMGHLGLWLALLCRVGPAWSAEWMVVPQLALDAGRDENPRGLTQNDTNHVSSAFMHAGCGLELIALVDVATEWSLRADYQRADFLDHGLGDQAWTAVRGERWTVQPGYESVVAVSVDRYEDAEQPGDDRTAWAGDVWRRGLMPGEAWSWLVGGTLEQSEYDVSGESETLVQVRTGPRLQWNPSWALSIEGYLAAIVSGDRQQKAGAMLQVEGSCGPRILLLLRGAYDGTAYDTSDLEQALDREDRWSAEAEVHWRWRPDWEWFGQAGWATYDEIVSGGTVEEVSGRAGLVLTFEWSVPQARK